MKPLIGILLRPDQNCTGRDVEILYQTIRNVIQSKGGIPLGFTLPHQREVTEEEKEDLYRILSTCNGVLLQGGEDFYPYDIETVKFLYEKDIPTLGICLGMQTMACSLGGKIEDFQEANHMQKGIDYVHSIKLDTNSKLYEIIGKESFLVNSRHKSYVKSTNLDKVGYSDDNVLEAVEDKTKKFFIGVQWHPEDLFTYDTVASLLFDSFIQACTR